MEDNILNHKENLSYRLYLWFGGAELLHTSLLFNGKEHLVKSYSGVEK